MFVLGSQRLHHPKSRTRRAAQRNLVYGRFNGPNPAAAQKLHEVLDASTAGNSGMPYIGASGGIGYHYGIIEPQSYVLPVSVQRLAA